MKNSGMTTTSDIVTPRSASATLHDTAVTVPPQTMPWSLVEPSRRHRDHGRQERVVSPPGEPEDHERQQLGNVTASERTCPPDAPPRPASDQDSPAGRAGRLGEHAGVCLVFRRQRLH